MDTAALDMVMRATADRLTAMHPDAAMSASVLRTEVQLSVWDHHGVYNNVRVGRDITSALTAVAGLPLTGTRAAYALRLREQLGAVTR
ncbi:hypothetical protein ACFVWX_13475 [Streptomyces sp. NPDC058220]|uniref:hypothetical protein n=1 Tax=Streptomyces sp. NPDC058220 TaxID=3346387 RepID=UPI0036E81109